MKRGGDAEESGGSSGSSSASGSGSGSASSGGSGSDEEEATVLGASFRLPRELCEDPDVFREFLSARTWESLSEAECRHLRRFLPDFPENDAEEKEVTLRRLFARDNFRFSSPLVQFQKRLAAGEFRTSGARLRKKAARARIRRARLARARAWRRSLRPVLLARERLLALADALPPGARPPPPPPDPKPAARLRLRATRRFRAELSAIHKEVCGESGGISEEDELSEGPLPPIPKQHRRYLSQLQNAEGTVFSTLGQGHHILNGSTIFSEEWKQKALSIHRRRRELQLNHSELDTTGITLNSVKSRTGDVFIKDEPIFGGGNVSQNFKMQRTRYRSSGTMRAPPSLSDSASDDDPNRLNPSIAVNPNSSSTTQPILIPLSTAPLPPSSPMNNENASQESPGADEEIGLQLVQATHACFLSVIRDLVCSTPRHCLPLPQLEARLRNWRQNPIAPLNHWYSSVEDWVKALPSAVSFLTGESSSQPEDFVPYLQYKPATQVYQWIGAGRDSDSLLLPLCGHWLSHRQSVKSPAPATASAPIPVSSPVLPIETIEGLTTPPSSKWNSRWQVSPEELEIFRTQEALRFRRPHRAFTYRLPRGNVVVGPLKGVYGSDEMGGGTGRGARGHTLLTATRPRHVTLLALVRDAVACLPGGEGTRAHITALLRRSQYLVPDAGEQALQAAVSGALDRMHGTSDPCVHYLPARKLWIYQHGNRTEEEFERLHAETQVLSKNKAVASVQQKRNITLPKLKPSRPVKPVKSATSEAISGSAIVEEEVDNEDINIDVEGPDVPSLPLAVQTPPPLTLTVPSVPPPMNTEKINMAVSVMSGTSLLQPRAPVFTSTMLKRGGGTVQVGTSRSVVRVLSSTSTAGKSLISPRALQTSTPPPDTTPRPVTSQAKLVVQRQAGQTTGALTPVQQKRLLESLMRHQRQHGQPMTHDQLLHTIHSTQKMSSSPIVTPSPVPVSVTKSATSTNQTLQLAGQTVQLPSGQTVQLTGQAVQLTSQTVQLTGQTVQLGGQTVQIGGQTVQLGGQSVQLVGQTRPASDSATRPPAQRPQTPLVAKILTSAQLRSSGNIGVGTPTGGLRLSGLSLAQLQGKPLLLQTNAPSKSSGIILQAAGNLGNSTTVAVAGNVDQRPTVPRPNPPTTQHTLLLSNLGGQVVRVAGSGALLGSTLRLQSPSAPVQGSSGVLLGGHALKLQTAPIRLHQSVAGNAGAGRVLLTSGTRLHSVKLLPVHHSIARGGGVSGRQVYARIVSPATANVGGTNAAGPSGLVVGLRPTTPISTSSPVVSSANTLPPSR